MGFDPTDENTFGYCKPGDNPIFKLHKTSSKEVVDLVSSNIPKWSTNQVHLVTLSALELPRTISLEHAYPNPFNPTTYIRYSVPYYEYITIDIFNVRGQIIKTLIKQLHQPGNYETLWDGTNHNGTPVPSGIYFYKMNATDFISVRKLVLLK